MKKFFVAAFAAIAALTFSACGNKAPKANLDSDVDTLSYAIGMTQSQGLDEYLAERLGVDSTYQEDFIKGLIEGANAGDDKQKAAYYAGVQIGQQIANQMVKGINYQIFGEDSTKTISMKNFLAGFLAGYKKDNGAMKQEDADKVVNAMMEKINQKRMAEQAKEMEKTYAKEKAMGEQYLADNAKKEGVTVLPSGVQYKVLKEGNGAKPTADQTVVVNYELRLIDGTVVESSFDKEPATFPLSSVIPGWTEALQLMPVGSVWEITIPQDKAYGPQGKGAIKPFSTLIFKVELLEVK